MKITRREFLKKVAAASAVISVAPAILVSPAKASMAPGIKVIDLSHKIPAMEPTSLEKMNAHQFTEFVRKNVEQLLESYRFSPNDDPTRNHIKYSIVDYMHHVNQIPRTPMMAFEVICDESNNPPWEIDKNRVTTDIWMSMYGYIKPIRLRITYG